MFQVSSEAIDTAGLGREMINHAGGAFVSFEGRVRKTNDGRSVERLDYELFPEMCIEEGQRILEEAKALFPIIEVGAIHRYGSLELGDVAVWVGVITGHRGAGFQACRFIIDAIKSRCPIWKKETYVDGPSEWVGCPSCEHKGVSAPQIFSRQAKILGHEGQKRLKNSQVLVVGTGGLGCPLALNLAAAGVGKLRLMDGDKLEASNLQRQTLFGYQDIGAPKALLAKRRLEELHPYVTIEAIAEHLTPQNLAQAFEGIDLVIDCSDNFATKYLINDHCVRLQKTFIQASIYQNQGQIFAYNPGQSACLRCDRPIQPPKDCTDTCADAGVLGAATSALGSLEALEAIKILLGQTAKSLNEQIYLDFDSFENFSLPRDRNRNCPFGFEHDQPQDFVYDDEALYPSGAREILYSDIAHDSSYICIDIRELSERTHSIENSIHLPLSQWQPSKLSIYQDAKLVFYCQTGKRSRELVERILQDSKIDLDCWSLRGGISSVFSHQC